MLKKTVPVLLAILLLALTTSGITPDVQAKGEGGAPPGTKEVPPYIEGTLILLRDGTASFVGDCVTPYDTRFFNISFGVNIDVAVASGDPVPTNNVEGSVANNLSVPAGCYKDNSTVVNVVIKSVKNFTPDGPPGVRTSIVARVVVARFVSQ